MSRVLILSTDHYAIPDEKTGAISDIFQVYYVSPYADDERRQGSGYKPMKAVIDQSQYSMLKKAGLPALAEVDYEVKPGAGGRATVAIRGFVNPEHVELF